MFRRAESVVRPAGDRKAGAVAGGDVARPRNSSTPVHVTFLLSKNIGFVNKLTASHLEAVHFAQ